jgi:hypothetical protein
MPVLPNMQQRQARQTVLNIQPVREEVNSKQGFIQGALNFAENEINVMQEKENRDARAFANIFVAEQEAKETFLLEELKQNANRGGVDFTKNYKDLLDKNENETLELIRNDEVNSRYLKNPEAMDFINLAKAKRRAGLTLKAMGFEAKKQVEYRDLQIKSAKNTIENTINLNTDYLDEGLKLYDAMLENQGVTGNDLSQKRMEAQQSFTAAAIQGTLDKDPNRALELINSGKYNNVLEPDALNTFKTKANNQIEKIQNKQRKEINIFKRELEDGVVPEKETLKRVIQQSISIGDTETAEKLQNIDNAQQYIKNLSLSNVDTIQSAYDEMLNNGDYKKTPQGLQIFKSVETLLNTTRAKSNNPYELATKRDIYKPEEIPDIFDGDGLLSEQGLVERAPIADDLSKKFDTTVKFFRDEELNDYQERWQKLNAEQQIAEINKITKQLTIPEDRNAVIKQLFGKDTQNTLGIVTSLVGDNEADLGQSVIRGMQAIKNKTVSLPTDAVFLESFRETYGDVINNPEHVKQIMSVIKAKSAQLASDDNLTESDIISKLETITEDIIGIKVKTGSEGIFGRKTKPTISFKLPDGNYATGRRINQIFEKLGKIQKNESEVLGIPLPYAGGKVANFKDIIDNAELKPIGKGLYHAYIGTDVITTGEKGKKGEIIPYVFNLPALNTAAGFK